MSISDGPTSLYRFFDADGTLLYVGITNALHTRLKGHESTKPWWELVRSIRVDHLPTRQAALEAEAVAIRREHPAFNIAGRPEGAHRTHEPEPPKRSTVERGVLARPVDLIAEALTPDPPARLDPARYREHMVRALSLAGRLEVGT